MKDPGTGVSRPTEGELRALGAKLLNAVSPLLASEPGLEVIICYTLPREGVENVMATSVVASHDDHKKLFVTLVHIAKDVHAIVEGSQP